jgi:hypothetical protein
MIDESKCDEENYLTKSQETSFTGKERKKERERERERENKREVIDNV